MNPNFKNFKTITYFFLEILVIGYFGALRAYPSMTDDNQLKWHDQFELSTDAQLNAKNQKNHSIFYRHIGDLFFICNLDVPDHA